MNRREMLLGSLAAGAATAIPELPAVSRNESFHLFKMWLWHKEEWGYWAMYDIYGFETKHTRLSEMTYRMAKAMLLSGGGHTEFSTGGDWESVWPRKELH